MNRFRPEHLLIKPSEDDKYLCGWCNPESVYGIDSDKVTTGGGLSLKEALKSKAQ